MRFIASISNFSAQTGGFLSPFSQCDNVRNGTSKRSDNSACDNPAARRASLILFIFSTLLRSVNGLFSVYVTQQRFAVATSSHNITPYTEYGATAEWYAPKNLYIIFRYYFIFSIWVKQSIIYRHTVFIELITIVVWFFIFRNISKPYEPFLTCFSSCRDTLFYSFFCFRGFYMYCVYYGFIFYIVSYFSGKSFFL